MTQVVATNETILVVGAGISGMTSALEAAETGKNVILIEKRPFVGGRITQLYKYFPKLCFPTCGLEINQRRAKANTNLDIITMAEVVDVSGSMGDYTVKIKLHPRYVNDRCTACGDCATVVEAEFDNEFNYNLDKRKGAYLPYNMAHPQRYVLDPRIIGTADADKAKAACKFGAIDLEMQEEKVTLKVGAIIWATGWRPYDADKIQPYGHDRIQNVLSSVEFERLMDPFGPTGGKLIRPSDGKEAKNVAFIQCAGSRDRNHLRHCSRICCMASLKQSTYVFEKYGDEAKVTIYYIDIRSIDRLEDFYKKIQANPNVNFVKSKVARIDEHKSNGNPICRGVDTEGCHHYNEEHDLVILAVGMEPSIDKDHFPVDVVINRDGFIELDEKNGGIFAAGSAADALDVNRSVQSATAAALRAIQVVNKVGSVEA